MSFCKYELESIVFGIFILHTHQMDQKVVVDPPIPSNPSEVPGEPQFETRNYSRPSVSVNLGASELVVNFLLTLALSWTKDTYTNLPLRVCLIIYLCSNSVLQFLPKSLKFFKGTLRFIQFNTLILMQVFYSKENDPLTKFVTFFVMVIELYLPLGMFVFIAICLLIYKCCMRDANANNVPVPNPTMMLKRLKSHVMRTDSAETCSICTEEYKQGDSVRTLPCKHEFHKNCVDKWLITAGRTCPLCRDNVVNALKNTANSENVV